MFSQVCVCSTLGGGAMGVPHPRFGRGGGISSQVWMGGYPGYPPPSRPGLDGGGYPPPAKSGWWEGYLGVPTPPPPIRQSSIASTCSPAGGMSLAFTQEDFLFHSTYSMSPPTHLLANLTQRHSCTDV